jgi:hypothetical protein
MTRNWAAGFVGPCPAELNGCEGNSFVDTAVTLVINSWADSSIVLGGFSGAWGAPGTNWTLASGDQVQFYVWNAQTGAFAGSITTTSRECCGCPGTHFDGSTRLRLSRLLHPQRSMLF